MAEKILFFFSALGVFNAILLTVYLLSDRSPLRAVTFISGIILGLLTLRVGVSCFHYFGAVTQEHIKLGLIANLLVGPMILLLVSTKAEKLKLLWTWKLLLHPLGWLLLAAVAWLAFDFYTWNFVLRFCIHTVLGVYLLYGGYTLREQLLALPQSARSGSAQERRVLIVYCFVVLTCLGFVISLYTNYIIGPLVFTLFLYLACAVVWLLPPATATAYPKKIMPEDSEIMQQRLADLMTTEALFLNANLTLPMLAERLGMSKHRLSQLLNDNLGQSFHQYLAGYRIEAAKEILVAQPHLSVEAVGLEVGFNSRSTFFAHFKQQTGITPASFRAAKTSV